MFDQNIYRGAFDTVHAPDGTQKEILDMTVNKNKKNLRFGRKITAIAIAACLMLSLAVVAYAIGKAALISSHWNGENEYTSYSDISKAASEVNFPVYAVDAYSAPMVQPNRGTWCTVTAEMVHPFRTDGARVSGRIAQPPRLN